MRNRARKNVRYPERMPRIDGLEPCLQRATLVIDCDAGFQSRLRNPVPVVCRSSIDQKPFTQEEEAAGNQLGVLPVKTGIRMPEAVMTTTHLRCDDGFVRGQVRPRQLAVAIGPVEPIRIRYSLFVQFCKRTDELSAVHLVVAEVKGRIQRVMPFEPNSGLPGGGRSNR